MHLTLSDLENLMSTDGPYFWISPQDIKGIDVNEVLSKNRAKWFKTYKRGIQDDTPDIQIVEYLNDCLITRKILLNNNQHLPPELDLDGVDFIKAAIYLICNLGSNYASTSLTSHKKLVDENNAQLCLKLLISEFNKAEAFIKDILRDFILEVFKYGPLWAAKGTKGGFYHVLSIEQNLFLDKIFEDGYNTLNNKDGRFFADGKRLI